MEGQVFVTSAIAITAIMMVALVPAGPSIFDVSRINYYFQGGFDQVGESFNEGLEQNSSTDSVERSVYTYLDTLEDRSSSKGIEMGAYFLGVFPQRGEAFLVNYREDSLEYEFEAGTSSSSGTLEPLQSTTFTFTPGSQEFRLNASDDSYVFDAAQPRSARWMYMQSGEERWENSDLG